MKRTGKYCHRRESGNKRRDKRRYMRWNNGFYKYECAYEYVVSYHSQLSPIERSILQFWDSSSHRSSPTIYSSTTPALLVPPTPHHHSPSLVWGIYEDRATPDSPTNYRRTVLDSRWFKSSVVPMFLHYPLPFLHQPTMTHTLETPIINTSTKKEATTTWWHFLQEDCFIRFM